jgi:LuxR family maltose regulon positive regulatory protein
MSTPLLITKLYVPPVRAEMVPRPRLIERLNAGLWQGGLGVGKGGLGKGAPRKGLGFAHRLTLVSAPAGFGKTTLVSEWIHGLGVRYQTAPGERRDAPPQVVWLSLDEGDNDPVLFLPYLIAALQQLDETIGEGAQSLLQSPQLPSGQGLATQLLNELSTFPNPFILVLDDYQAIRCAEIHEMLGFLIDNQPPQMHTVIATRRDPRLPLARWRARGESTEIRTPDLRFTVDEARDFMNLGMGLDLTVELVEALGARTEGWIAGLQLAALALQGLGSRGSQDPADFVRQFSGSDRYVIDYLVDEVLQRQPAYVRRFLQQTAILKELSAPLCDYVRFGSAKTESSSHGTDVRFEEAKTETGQEDSAAILREVERANLFLIPLDNRREWYRYHHLFAEVVVMATDEGETQTLHRRAASWYEGHGRLSRAIHHALAGGDLENVIRLIKVAAPDQLQQAGFVRVLSWLDALPDAVVRSDAELATYKGYTLLWRGDAEAAEFYADAAEKSLPEGAAVARGQFLTLRAHLHAQEVIPLATEAIELMDESCPFFYGAALLLLALGHKKNGNVADMMEVFGRLARLEERRNPFLAAVAIGEMADVLRLQGKRREALRLCQRAMEQYRDSRGRPLPSLVVVLLIDAMLAYEANDLSLALQRSEQSATIAQQAGMSFLAAQCKCYVDLPCRRALGERAAAWAALEQARQLATDDHPLYPEASLDAGSCRAWLHLKEANIRGAARWTATFDLPPGILPYDRSHVYLNYVRVLLAQEKLQEAAEALQRLETWAIADGWDRVLLTVALLRSIAAQKSGDEASAMDYLAQALPLAAEEDYRRAFLDEDPVIFELLPRLHAHQGGIATPIFVDGLLKEFADERRRASPEAEPKSDAEGKDGVVSLPSSVLHRPSLIEPLTKRELDVLRLLAEGLTTPEIANRLYISAGTAKWHTINVYRKLDVHGRVQAVTRAHELGLL